MLIRRETLDRIRAGEVSVAFRRWAAPRVRVGTRMRTAVGLVEVTSLEAVDPDALTEADARAAGAADRAALVAANASVRADRPLWRIGLRYAGEDPRRALREAAQLDARAVRELVQRLERIDARSRRGPWTRTVLELIARRPQTRAAELAAELGLETRPFKADVRKLKELGLTESLEVGYRLSPRGRALLDAIARG